MSDECETTWGVFGPVNACCGVTASVGHDLYCVNRPVSPRTPAANRTGRCDHQEDQ